MIAHEAWSLIIFSVKSRKIQKSLHSWLEEGKQQGIVGGFGDFLFPYFVVCCSALWCLVPVGPRDNEQSGNRPKRKLGRQLCRRVGHLCG